MFKRKKMTLESHLDCEDRGQVAPKITMMVVGLPAVAEQQICQRCKHILHVVLFRSDYEARLACPVCLYWLREEGDDGYEEEEPQPKPKQPRAEAPRPGTDKPRSKNRITRYLKSDGNSEGPRSPEQNLSNVLANESGARLVVRGMAG